MLKVYQAQDFGSYECKCVQEFETSHDEEYYDTHIFCTTHQQWWVDRSDTDSYSRWMRVRDEEVPDAMMLMMATSDKFRSVEVQK